MRYVLAGTCPEDLADAGAFFIRADAQYVRLLYWDVLYIEALTSPKYKEPLVYQSLIRRQQ